MIRTGNAIIDGTHRPVELELSLDATFWSGRDTFAIVTDDPEYCGYVEAPEIEWLFDHPQPQTKRWPA